MVIEQQFAATMRKAWATKPTTRITGIERNLFLVQFVTEEDMTKVLRRGTWNYRMDAVVIRQIRGPPDLIQPAVSAMDVWVQWHRIPSEAVSHSGILKLAKRLGTPISAINEAVFGGSKFQKVRLRMDIDKPLQDKLEVRHPSLGVFSVFLTYELHRVCLFCGGVGHEHQACPDKARLEIMKIDPIYKDLPAMNNITALKFGPWINDPSQIPEKETSPIDQPQWNQLGASQDGPNHGGRVEDLTRPKKAKRGPSPTPQSNLGGNDMGLPQYMSLIQQEEPSSSNQTTNSVDNDRNVVRTTQRRKTVGATMESPPPTQ